MHGVGSTKLVLCPESRRSARGRLLLCTYIVISIRAIAIVSFIERLSSGGRVRYGRFHCIAFYVSLDYTSTVSRLALHVLTVIANSANFTRFSP